MKNLRTQFRDLYDISFNFPRLGLLDISLVGSKSATSRILSVVLIKQTADYHHKGGVAEWSIAPVLKTFVIFILDKINIDYKVFIKNTKTSNIAKNCLYLQKTEKFLASFGKSEKLILVVYPPLPKSMAPTSLHFPIFPHRNFFTAKEKILALLKKFSVFH